MPTPNSTIPEIARFIPEGLPLGLRNYWFPILQSEELPQDSPVALRALGEALVAWRDGSGRPCVARDRCPHRSIRLSAGRILDGQLQCVLHGLRFDGSGRCTLIPWETEHSPQQDQLGLHTYRAQELGGYVWAYIGDDVAFPAPPLESEVPEELLHPDKFICFRLPTQVWKVNWLLAIDGSDAYHAVILHANSQAVQDKEWVGGRVLQADVPLADRRVRLVETSHGIRGVAIDKSGKPLHHGHFTVDVKGDRFALPCINTNPIVAAPGAAPYASRLWQFPIDETHTHVARFLTWRAETGEARETATSVFEEIALPRLEKVATEDAMAAEAQGDLVEARSHEHLLSPDQDLVKLRRFICEAYLTQCESGQRLSVPAGALVFPV